MFIQILKEFKKRGNPHNGGAETDQLVELGVFSIIKFKLHSGVRSRCK